MLRIRPRDHRGEGVAENHTSVSRETQHLVEGEESNYMIVDGTPSVENPPLEGKKSSCRQGKKAQPFEQEKVNDGSLNVNERLH